MLKTCGLIFLASIWLCAFPAQASDQISPPATSQAESNKELMTQLLALRGSFTKAIKAQGFTPRLPAPTIVLDNPPSYGNYENDKNVLHIAVWSALTDEQRGRFERLSRLLNNGKAAEETFEESVHHWIFVHELAHWWQACQRKISSNHYSVEYGANRIAAAFWRQNDPYLMQRTENRMATVIRTLPNPLPEGQTEGAYFNENYEKLGPTPAYIWFQYTMVLKVQAERPLPSLKQTLSKPTFP
jgi:hypothetical protein